MTGVHAWAWPRRRALNDSVMSVSWPSFSGRRPALVIATCLLLTVVGFGGAEGTMESPNIDKIGRYNNPQEKGMVYFIKRGIDIKPSQPSFVQRVKRSLGMTEDDKPQIESLRVSSNISSRFSQTVVHSDMINPWDTDKQATFRVLLPEKAFMSNFTMLIDDELYIAEVKSKEEAKEEYEKARDENKTAGLVENERWTPEEQIRGMEKFKMSVNVAAQSSIQFTLTYQELLERRFGLYEQRISVRPDQLVDDLEVTVSIYEDQGITSVEVIEPGNDILPLYTTVTHTPEDIVAVVSYQPTKEQQKSKGATGVKGDLVVRYDVMHTDDIGLVQVEGDYFVHFFSPSSENLSPLPKNIIFVIDISGSMSGDKIVQTRESLLVILEQLRPEDSFLIMLFDDDQEYWPGKRSDLVKATNQNIQRAKGFVRERVKVDGGTNINDALVEAAFRLRASEQYGASMIVFLTDGEPTVGETSTEAILANINDAAQGKVSIFSLGFGFYLNYDLLRAISLRNGGFARRIYADVDADVQLQDFFNEINTPLLYDVRLTYDFSLISVTKSSFAQFFEGSEIAVTGKFEGSTCSGFNAKVEAMAVSPWSTQDYITCQETIVVPVKAKEIFRHGSLERLYTYLKIKDVLDQVLMTDSSDEKKRLEDFALQMALEYHLVTPLTSFVVTQNLQSSDPDGLMEEAVFDTALASYPRAGAAPASRKKNFFTPFSTRSFSSKIHACTTLFVMSFFFQLF